MNDRTKLQLIAPSASPEEAAAIAAALEQFTRNHAPAASTADVPVNPWLRAAMLEGVDRHAEAPTAWGDGHPWG